MRGTAVAASTKLGEERDDVQLPPSPKVDTCRRIITPDLQISDHPQ